ncbi:OmpA family protein [Granulosicoccus sp. 3-233]|uniref:OmpA family protein n=1 Tax=Granulosicoccus sp. 3-233 TaxID=3417969 RepID=UPI003D34905E
MIEMFVEGRRSLRQAGKSLFRPACRNPAGGASRRGRGPGCRLALSAGLLGSVMVLAGCSSVGGSRADRDFQPRVYAGAGVLASRLEPDTDGVAGTSVDENMSGGASLALGYDINSRFSVEGHVAALGEASLDPRGSIDYTVAGLSALAYGSQEPRDRARREGLAVFGRLGVGALENDASGVRFNQVNDVHLLAGVGLEYGLVNGVGVRAELVAHETDAKYAQLGLIYRFGSTDSGRSATRSQPEQPTILPEVNDIPVEGVPLESVPPIAVADPEPLPDRPEPVAPAVSQTDADGDGVPDSEDQCPGTAANAPVKTDGCAIFGGVVEGVNFQPGSARLTAEALDVMAGVAQTLKDYPDVRVIIEAHTDNEGSAAVNLQLSKRRAIAVARYLVDAGISGSRLKPQAYGESRPRTSNRTAQGRAANRRVEFSILQ